MDHLKLTISVPEAGRRLGLGRNSSYDAARRGELPILRFGRSLRVPVVALEQMLSDAVPIDRNGEGQRRNLGGPSENRGPATRWIDAERRK